MRPLSRKLLSAIALGLISLALSTTSAHAQQIIKIVGNASAASITRNGSNIAVSENMAIQAKDVINTGAGVDIYVQPYAGVIATVKQNSHATVEALSADDATLDLSAGGSVVAQIEPNKNHHFQVRTPKGVAAAKGTVYTVTVNGNTYSVATFAGAVVVTPMVNGVASGVGISIGSGSVTSDGNPPVSLAAASGGAASAGNFSEAAAAAVSALAVVASTGGSAGATASALLTTAMATVVATNNTTLLAQVTAQAAAAAPTQAAALVTAAVSAGASGTQVEATAQAAAQGATLGATQGSNGTTTADATAAITAIKTEANKSTNVDTTKVDAAVQAGQFAGSNGVTQVTLPSSTPPPPPTAPVTPVTPIDPSINVSPSGGR